jgi:hypothetical protein
MTRKQRLGVVISAVWMLAAMIIAVDASYRENFQTLVSEFQLIRFVQHFILLGVIPLAIGWGIWWIRKA